MEKYNTIANEPFPTNTYPKKFVEEGFGGCRDRNAEQVQIINAHIANGQIAKELTPVVLPQEA